MSTTTSVPSEPTSSHGLSGEQLREVIQEKYGAAAREARSETRSSSCCGGSCGAGAAADPITSNLYAQEETAGLPYGAVLASLGCGNPTALDELAHGEVVLDLG